MSVTAGGSQVSGVWTNVYILRKFVEMLKDELLFSRFSEPAMIPKNTGGYVARWNIPVAYKGSTTVITEASAGTVGELTSTTINNVESTINTYGEFMKLGEIAQLSWTPGTADVFAEQFSFAGASAIDSLLYTQAKTTSNFLHSGDVSTAGVTLGTGDVAQVSDFHAIAGFFYGQNARGFRDVGNDFVWLMHPNQEIDLTTELTTSSNAFREVFSRNEIGFRQLQDNHRLVGRMGSVTALRTTMIGTVDEDVTAYVSIALAKWGLGWAGLGEQGPTSPEIKRKRPGPQDTSQPLDLYETIAWKVKMAGAMLDASRVLVVYSWATTFDPSL